MRIVLHPDTAAFLSSLPPETKRALRESLSRAKDKNRAKITRKITITIKARLNLDLNRNLNRNRNLDLDVA